jgi:hypothetical protein
MWQVKHPGWEGSVMNSFESGSPFSVEAMNPSFVWHFWHPWPFAEAEVPMVLRPEDS